MAGFSGVGSGAAGASGSAKTAPAASTVDALSMSRLESLLSRMFGHAACGLGATAHLTTFTTLGIRRNPAATLNAEKDTTPVTALHGCCHPIARGQRPSAPHQKAGHMTAPDAAPYPAVQRPAARFRYSIKVSRVVDQLWLILMIGSNPNRAANCEMARNIP